MENNKIHDRRTEYERYALFESEIEQVREREKELRAKQKASAQKIEKNRTHVKVVVGGAIVSAEQADRFYQERIPAKERNANIRKFADSCRVQREFGRIAEQILDRAVTDDDLERFRKYLEMQERNGLYFSKFMGK